MTSVDFGTDLNYCEMFLIEKKKKSQFIKAKAVLKK